MNGVENGIHGDDPFLSHPSSMRLQLQSLLEDKEHQLQLAGTLGQKILEQQAELEQRINALSSATEDDPEVRRKLTDLAEAMNQWEIENEQLWGGFGQKAANGNGRPPQTPLTPSASPPRQNHTELAEAPSSSLTAAQSSRRAKNAQHRENDVKFAYDIGTSLLTEVRRLQSLLNERDGTIKDLVSEKDDLEKESDTLRASLRQQEAASTKFTQENWDLEVQIQDIKSQLAESNSALSRAEGESRRLNKQLGQAREQVEATKADHEKLHGTFEEFKGKHDTTVAQNNRALVQLEREKTNLQATLDAVKVEAAKREKVIKGRWGSPMSTGGTREVSTPGNYDDGEGGEYLGTTGAKKTPFLTPGGQTFDQEQISPYDSSPDPSPSKPSITLAPNHPSKELEALTAALEHERRHSKTLQGTIRKLKEQKIAMKKQFASEGVGMPGGWDEDEDDADVTIEEPAVRSPVRFANRGRPTRGRGSKIMSLTQKLGLASVDKQLATGAYDWEDEKTPLSPPANDDEEPSPFIVPSSRPTSVDGMDPAFANVLRNSPSPLKNSEPVSPSPPLRKSRAGAAFRPDSMAGDDKAPSSLGAELSGLGGVALGVGAGAAVLEGLETEDDEPSVQHQPSPIKVPEVVAPVKVTLDSGMQTEPEVIPAPIVIERAELAIQTDVPPTPTTSYSEGGMSTEPLPVPPQKITTEMDIQTDPIPQFEDVMQAVEIQEGGMRAVRDVEIRSMVISREEVEHPGLAVPFPVRSPSEAEFTEDETIPARTPRVLSMASVRSPRPVAMIFEEPDTETEPEGEWADARESVNDRTPADSLTDFHSAVGGSSMDGHAAAADDSDAESVRTSRMAVREKYTSLSTHGRKATARLLAVPPSIPISRVEIKEQAVQTDEWVPPAPLAPAVPPSPVFKRVGTYSNAPPFHFISSPPRPDMSFVSGGTATPTQAGLSPGARTPLRESAATFGVGAAAGAAVAALANRSGSRADRRMSFESAISQGEEARVPLTPVDRTKPPVMIAPPPPSMPPPSIIPANKKAIGMIPPPRPTSPPPPELIQRATTPTFGLARSTTPSLNVPMTMGRRPNHPSLPSNQGLGLRQPPSTSSFRSAPTRARDPSMTSLLSAGVSRRPSVSSDRSSDMHVHYPASQPHPQPRKASQPTPPAQTLEEEAADLDVIHAITQTMIGEFLYKYTRKVVGKGHGEKRHRRFFWIHPYTKTLYWSDKDPGGASIAESSAKSAYIESVKSILDPNPLPVGVHQYSIVVTTPQREMKFTAPTLERHEIWYRALKYLLDRPATIPPNSLNSPAEERPSPSPRQRKFSEDQNGMLTSPRSIRSAHSYSITPRAMRSQTQLSIQNSIGKRAGTPAAEYLRWAEEAQKSPTRSIGSFRHGPSHTMDDDDYDHVDAAEETFELAPGDDEYEALENVRACCDGEHDLGTLSRRPGQPPRIHHHHHHHGSHSRPQTPAERPASPSAWSFRSRAGSTVSEGGSRLSQWAGDAKRSIRFNNRGKSPATRPPIPLPRSNN